VVSRDAVSSTSRGASVGPVVGISLGVLGWVGFLVLSASPALGEAVAGTGPIPALRRSVSLVTGVIPFPLAEIFVGFVVWRQIRGLWVGIQSRRTGSVATPRLLGAGALRLSQDLGVLLFLFYLLWGFQYARPGLEDQLGIPAAGEVSVEELRRLATRAVDRGNELYHEIHGSPDSGEPTAAPRISLALPGLEEAWVRVDSEYGLRPEARRRHGAPKAFLASPVMKRLGVAGMYFPYTGEALVLRDLPGIVVGMDLGHEMAHQRGFASESDANVLGFLVARASPDAIVRYSAYSFLQRQLVSALQRASPTLAREVVRGREPGVTRDLQDLQEYWEPARGVAGRTATRMNDAMLRSHGIPEGVASYQGSVWVLVALARARGEDALF
jgi:hypothetical protein